MLHAYRQIPNADVTLTSETGPYTFRATSVSRGQGDRKYELFIDGVGSVPDGPNHQYYVEFGGKWCGALVQVLGSKEDFCRVRASTFISDPSFWE
jgi:hypothetical protein